MSKTFQKQQIDILYIHPEGNNPLKSENFFIKPQNIEFSKEESKKYYAFIPMGIIGILNNIIKKGYSVKGINLPLKKSIYNFNLAAFLENTNTKIIVIDIHWYIHLKSALEIAKLAKEKLPNVKIIVGGMTATIFASELIKEDSIDFVIKGDAEKPFEALIDTIINKKNNYENIPNLTYTDHDNSILYYTKDINDYDYLSLNFLEDHEQYQEMFDFWLLIAKGCIYNCADCDGNCSIYPLIYARDALIVRNPENIIEDIKKLESRKIQYMAFSHDINILSDSFQEALLQHKFKINLRNEFFQLPKKELIEKLAKSFVGLDLVFSPISASKKERKEHGKVFSNREFYSLLKSIRKINFRGGVIVYFSDYIISPLGIKELHRKKREKMIRKINKIYPGAMIEVQNQLIDPMCLITDHHIPKKRLFESFK